MKHFTNRGFSLVEMMIAVALMVGLGVAANNIFNFSRRESSRLTEDIQATISRYGGARVLLRDLTGAEPSFNYLNIQDDRDLPFFVLAPNELCRNDKCERRLTLELKPGANQSRSIYFIIRKGYVDEMLKFTIDPISTYDSRTYSGINWQFANEDQTLSKSQRPYSPWTKGRLLMLTSEMSFFDCQSMTQKNDGICTISCTPSGTCNYAGKRPLQFLGKVNDTESDLVSVQYDMERDIFKNRYLLCRPDYNLNCNSTIDIPALDTPKTFFEKLPFIPGMDNRSYVSPVEVVEYYLKKPTTNSPDHAIQLVRTKLGISGNKLIPEKSVPIMSGIQTIQFKRSNISNSLIEYKIKKTNMRKSVK